MAYISMQDDDCHISKHHAVLVYTARNHQHPQHDARLALRRYEYLVGGAFRFTVMHEPLSLY